MTAEVDPQTLPDATEDLPEQMRVRRAKRDALIEQGSDAYPVNFPRTVTLTARARWTRAARAR